MDYTRLRAFLDHLALHRDLIADAVSDATPPSGSVEVDCLLAGIAEKLCDDACLPRPGWVTGVPPLAREWAMPATPAMEARVRSETPPQLAARRIVMDAQSLWRPRLWGVEAGR